MSGCAAPKSASGCRRRAAWLDARALTGGVLTQRRGGAKGMGVLLTSVGGVAILVGDVKDVEQR